MAKGFAGRHDRGCRVKLRPIFGLVDHVPVGGEREPRIVPELTCDVDRLTALVQ